MGVHVYSQVTTCYILAILSKMHSYPKGEQKQLALNTIYLGWLTWNLEGKYTGVVWMHMYILKFLFTAFLALLQKMQFYSFFCISPRLSDQLTWNLVHKYIVVVCMFIYSFKSIIAIFLAILPKSLFLPYIGWGRRGDFGGHKIR